MPQLYNGIGTWYVGKEDILTTIGRCEACGVYGPQSSYTTTLYGLVFLIPILPLGRRRVLFECESCQRHGSVKLKQWLQNRREEYQRVGENVAANPSDPQALAEALSVSTAYQDVETFDRFAAIVGDQDDPDLLRAFAVGLETFGRPDQAAAVLYRLIEIKPDDDIRQYLAYNLCLAGRPAVAETFARQIVENKDLEHAGVVLLVAESYQGQGEFDKGLQLLDWSQDQLAELDADNSVTAMRQQLQSAAAKRRPSKTAHQKWSQRIGYSPGSKVGRFALLVGPAIAAVLLFVAFLTAQHTAGHRRAYLVNGLSRPYAVSVNGQVHDLQPQSHSAIELAEGDIAIEVADPRLAIDPQVLDVRTGFWDRVFGRTTIVINPDRSALVFKETVWYGSDPNALPEPQFEIFCGQPLHLISEVNFEFEEFPEQIKMKGSRESRTRVVIHQDLPITTALALLQQHGQPEQMRDYLVAGFRAETDGEPYLGILNMIEGSQFAMEQSKLLIDRRPVHLLAHRVYQSLSEELTPEVDLEPPYRALAAEEPVSPEHLYLLARVVRDRDESERLFEQAANANPPVPYAVSALARQRAAEGDFVPALELARRGCELEPNVGSFDTLLEQMLIANGRRDELLARASEQSAEDMNMFDLMIKTRRLIAAGHAEQARSAVDDYCAALQQQSIPAPDLQTLRHQLLAHLDYLTGNRDGFLENMRQVPDDESFEYAFTAGNLDKAAEWIDRPRETAARHLLLYLALADANRPQDAQKHFDQAINKLRNSSVSDRLAADYLEGKAPITPQSVRRLFADPSDKAVLLTVLGRQNPDQRQACLELARALNFDPSFPHLYLDQQLR